MKQVIAEFNVMWVGQRFMHKITHCMYNVQSIGDKTVTLISGGVSYRVSYASLEKRFVKA